MNIIILGAGQVGSTLADNLTRENHNVTVVDLDEGRLRLLQDRLDLRTVRGFASYPAVLRSAGAKDADMIVAVTDNDEVNMVACQVAYSIFNIPTKLARIRTPHYFIRQDLFGRADLPIDVFISPEQLVVSYISELINYPGALQVLSFAGGKVKLVGVKAYYGGSLIGKELGGLREHLPDIEMQIAAIYREDKTIALNPEATIQVGDEVFFVAAANQIRPIMAGFRRLSSPNKRIIIAGGGNIGSGLARTLENDYQVKVIDHNSEHCNRLAEQLKNTTVLLGDAVDKELLINENVEDCDVFCAVTNDDEANIMSCIQAKRVGARMVMALITRVDYTTIIEDIGINLAISPQEATTSSILTHVRRGGIVNVHSLRRGAAEAIEVVVHGSKDNSKVVDRALKEVKLPRDISVGAIVRGEKVIMPGPDVRFEANDHVILFVSNKKYVAEVEKLFQVGVTFV